MFIKYILLVVMVFFVALGPRLMRSALLRFQRRLGPPPPTPLLPPEIVGGAARTYVLFCTRRCVESGPIEKELRAAYPEANVVRIRADKEPQLASAFKVKYSPTVLLADTTGEVLATMVGPAAIKAHLNRVDGP